MDSLFWIRNFKRLVLHHISFRSNGILHLNGYFILSYAIVSATGDFFFFFLLLFPKIHILRYEKCHQLYRYCFFKAIQIDFLKYKLRSAQCSGWCSSVVRVLACALKVAGSISSQGHKSGLQVPSLALVGVREGRNQQMCLSYITISLSLPPSFLSTL